MRDVSQLARIQVGIVLTFVLNKMIIRPFVLESGISEALAIFVLSYANFCEAVVGTLALTAIGLVIDHRWDTGTRFNRIFIYILATAAAGIYVVTQELKIHNIGGQNVYDPNDLLFSLIGLGVSFVLLLFLKPQMALPEQTVGNRGVL